MDLTMIGVPKPRKEVTEFRFRKLKDVWIQRKWDGCCVFGVTSKGIFSRRTSLITKRKISYTKKFPHIFEELENSDLPSNSLVVGEMVWTPDHKLTISSKENFRILQKLTGSSDTRSAKLQSKFGSPLWVVFDLLFLDNEPAYLLPYAKRYEIIKLTLRKNKFIHVIRNINLSVKDAFEMAKQHSWEGLVLKDPEASTEIIENDVDNNIVRPDGYWKMKPKKELDAVVIGIELSKKDVNRVASLILALNSKNGLTEVGKVGVFEGFNWKYRYDLAKKIGKFNGRFYEIEPFVAKIRFDAWSSKNKLMKPVLYAISNKSLNEADSIEEHIK